MSKPAKKIVIERPAWTREIDEAVAIVNAESGTRSEETLHGLSRELRARQNYWVKRGPESPPTTRWILFLLSVFFTLLTLTAYLSAWFLFVYSCCLVFLFGLISLGLWIATIVVFLGNTPHDRRIRGRGVLCPECDYDLHSTPSAVNPFRLGGLEIGPRTCHECGCAWPFVFPPIP